VLEAAEGVGVDDAVAVALEGGANGVRLFGTLAPPREAAFNRVLREEFLPVFIALTDI
jgi:hypothetical protein